MAARVARVVLLDERPGFLELILPRGHLAGRSAGGARATDGSPGRGRCPQGGPRTDPARSSRTGSQSGSLSARPSRRATCRSGAHLEGAVGEHCERGGRAVADPQPPERGQVQVPAGDRDVDLGEGAGPDRRRGRDGREVASVRPTWLAPGRAGSARPRPARTGGRVPPRPLPGADLSRLASRSQPPANDAVGVFARPLMKQAEQRAPHAALRRASAGDALASPYPAASASNCARGHRVPGSLAWRRGGLGSART